MDIPIKITPALIILSGDKNIKLQLQQKNNTNWLWINHNDIIPHSELRDVCVYENTLENLISVYSKGEIYQNAEILNKFLLGMVCEYNISAKKFECYSCKIAVMPCCTGLYMSIVNRKEIM